MPGPVRLAEVLRRVRRSPHPAWLRSLPRGAPARPVASACPLSGLSAVVGRSVPSRLAAVRSGARAAVASPRLRARRFPAAPVVASLLPRVVLGLSHPPARPARSRAARPLGPWSASRRRAGPVWASAWAAAPPRRWRPLRARCALVATPRSLPAPASAPSVRPFCRAASRARWSWLPPGAPFVCCPLPPLLTPPSLRPGYQRPSIETSLAGAARRPSARSARAASCPPARWPLWAALARSPPRFGRRRCCER